MSKQHPKPPARSHAQRVMTEQPPRSRAERIMSAGLAIHPPLSIQDLPGAIQVRPDRIAE